MSQLGEHSTITFLFTDIEGSTQLWERHPGAMRHALAQHDQLLRQAIESNRGRVFKTVGDAFCATFPNPQDALKAAQQIQLELAQGTWPETGPLVVRIAIHTGPADHRDDDYFGPTLNRVARLLAVGHGGQTLITQAAHNLLPQDGDLQDLGEHRLKDLLAPEHIWQLGNRTFPSLKSLASQSTNLPAQLSSFIGREKEISAVKSLLAQARLLTLTGSGGTGKTRLALQAAADVLDQFPDGAWVVELAPLSDPPLVTQTVAEVVGVREHSETPILKSLLGSLKEKQMLFVLDNCEHLLEAIAHLAEAILRECPKVTILATSREALGIAGEQSYRVPSLSVPDPKQDQTPASIIDYESARLFIERAYAAKPDFAVTPENVSALASVCRRLDGIPLAVELAASRVRAMPLELIESRLDSRFRLLTGGSRTALPRQQTLRALIDWSFDLLNEEEKLLLGRLSVFHGGWQLESAEAVCAGDPIEEWQCLDIMTSLVDKSLASYMERKGITRYRLLETVRQYAQERLSESGNGESVRDRHRDYFLALAEEADPNLVGAEQAVWMDRLELEYDNLRAAIEWSLSETDPEKAVRFCAALWRFWIARDFIAEGIEECHRALRGPIQRTPETAKALHGLGALARIKGDYDLSQKSLDESLAIRREIGDRKAIAATLNSLGNLCSNLGRYDAATQYLKETLQIEREMGTPERIAMTLNNFAIACKNINDQDGWKAASEEALAISKGVGYTGGIASSLAGLGDLATVRGEYDSARGHLLESLSLLKQSGQANMIILTLGSLAHLCVLTKDPGFAVLLFAATGSLREKGSLHLDEVEQTREDQLLDETKTALGPQGFNDWWAKGYGLTLDETIAIALKNGEAQ